MRISATGPIDRPVPACGAAGFTLVEMLVVVAIVAVLASAMVLQLRPPDRITPASVVAELRRLIAAASDEAIFNGREFSLSFSRAGAVVLALDLADRTWARATSPDSIAAEVPFGNLVPTLAIEGRNVVLRAAGADLRPDAFLLSSGETTPFRLQVAADARSAPAELSLDPYGRVTLRSGRP